MQAVWINYSYGYMYRHQQQNYCECVMSDNKRTGIRVYSAGGDGGG